MFQNAQSNGRVLVLKSLQELPANSQDWLARTGPLDGDDSEFALVGVVKRLAAHVESGQSCSHEQWTFLRAQVHAVARAHVDGTDGHDRERRLIAIFQQTLAVVPTVQ